MKKLSYRFGRFPFAAATAAVLLLSAACGKKTPADHRAQVEIQSEPQGTIVTIKGIERGETPLKGKMNPGVYLVKFSRPGYKNHWEKLKLDKNERKKLLVKLEPETASVLITSSPDSAAVEFQGKKLGNTPVVISDLPHGKYTAELYRHGFSRQTASWTINSAIPKRVDLELNSNLGTLEITSHPSNAEVLLDGRLIGKTPLKEQVEEGRHFIELRKTGYISAHQSVEVKNRGTTAPPRFDLEIKPGSIKISSVPSGAKITVNGKPYGDTPFNLSNLKPGLYAIKLEKAGFDPAERQVNLPPGENLDLKLNLDSNTGGIDIVTQPAGLTLYLDGKKIGISEKDPKHENISKVFQVRNLGMGTHTLSIAHKRARPEKKTISFTIQKGKIVRPAGLFLWIPNAVIVRTNGVTETGRIVQDLPQKYEFEPSPGVKFTIEKNTVREVERLSETE